MSRNSIQKLPISRRSILDTENRATVKVEVDAMGGDHAPEAIIAGSVEAAKKNGIQIVLVGDSDVVEPELARHNTNNLPIATVQSQGVISENEHPAQSLRQKPAASVMVTTGLVKQGKVDACVTMGSTGAAMAAAAIVLGTMDGIDRPALGGPILGFSPNTVFVDLGSNVDCRPNQLLSFAVIGDVFAKLFWNIESPRVAILSVGSEPGKGNRQVKETTELISSSALNFIGNIESNDLAQNKAEVVVCDGFVGNIVLKLVEGLSKATLDLLHSRLQNKLSESDLSELSSELYGLSNVTATHGGGPLLGVKGVSIVGHGQAQPEVVCKAVETAKQFVELDFINKLEENLIKVHTSLDK